ncbi:hypothetical protein IQ266_01885 [filamentous cyanobacterium LEGE 11480]|uniref:Uncharacterized protein n=1 Tax=Romeriopsis navalis LEGE 11480 TaxID=2777977 RepID=A0A928VH39_9CYAN|nr:hypothetical protein [Romeriopsis navalis]MBE9028506.1 hypothetical protein [Romeriopsis navalis LEGE 11480]
MPNFLVSYLNFKVAMLVAAAVHAGLMLLPLPATQSKPKTAPKSVRISSLPTPTPTPTPQPKLKPSPQVPIAPKSLGPTPQSRLIQRQISPPIPTVRSTPIVPQVPMVQPSPNPSSAPSPSPSPSLAPNPSPSTPLSPSPTPSPSPSTTGGFVLNQAGGEPCGNNCTQAPPGFTAQDFRQKVASQAKGEIEEIRDEETESLLGWEFVNLKDKDEYWYRVSLTGPNQTFIDRYYQLPQRIETREALETAINQLAAT